MASHHSTDDVLGLRGRRNNDTEMTEMTEMTEVNLDTSVAAAADADTAPPHGTDGHSGSLQHHEFYSSEASTSSTTASLLNNNKGPNVQDGILVSDNKVESIETGLSGTSSHEGDVLRDEHGREISPIPEVAAVVANTDDPSIPCLTFRFWMMGLISILALSFVNQVRKKKGIEFRCGMIDIDIHMLGGKQGS